MRFGQVHLDYEILIPVVYNVFEWLSDIQIQHHCLCGCLWLDRISNKRQLTVNADSLAAAYHVSENSVKVYVDVNNGSQRSTKDYNKVSSFSLACATIDSYQVFASKYLRKYGSFQLFYV